MGRKHGGDAPDPLVRITNRRLSNQNVTVAVLSTSSIVASSWRITASSLRRNLTGDPELYRQLYHSKQCDKSGLFSKHVNLRKGATDIGYGLRRPIRWKKQRRIRVLTPPNR